MNLAALRVVPGAGRNPVSPDHRLFRDILTELLLGLTGTASVFGLLALPVDLRVPHLSGIAWRFQPGKAAALVLFAREGSPALEMLARRLADAELPVDLQTGVRFGAAAGPVSSGDSVGSSTSGRSGTMGCMLVSRSDRTAFGLSCNHVVADLNAAVTGHSVVWAPGAKKGGHAASRLGVVHDFAPIDFTPGAYNEIDAAIILPDSSAVVDVAIRGIGRPSGTGAPPVFGDTVRTFGAETSRLRSGTYLYDINALVEYDDGSKALFRDMLGIVGTSRNFAVQGDSGAAVVDDADGVVGMVVSVASGIDLTLACRIQSVLDFFGMDIST